MEIIRRLSEMIEEEISDVEKYAKCASAVKAEYPELGDLFYRLSEEEKNHTNMLHDAVTRVINKYKAEHGEPPSDMLFVYNYLHERHLEAMAEAINYQKLYKESV